MLKAYTHVDVPHVKVKAGMFRIHILLNVKNSMCKNVHQQLE